MKATFAIAITLITLLFAGLLIGPSFMDWNKYKPQIIEQAKSSAGYDIHIDGDIGLSVLPVPRLKLEGLSVDAPRGKEQKLISVKEAYVSVNLFPLLSGNIVVDTVRLENPVIALEKLPDGSVSWTPDSKQATSSSQAPAAAKSSDAGSLVLDKVIINKGQVSYLDRQTGASHEAKDINMSLSAQSLQGPFKADGELVLDGRAIGVNFDTKKISSDKKEIDANVKFTLPKSDAYASFNGVVSLEPMEVQGKIDIKAKDLGAALADPNSDPITSLAQPLTFSGLVTANENQVRSQEVEITFGDTKGSGDIVLSNIKDQNPVKLDANFAFKGVLNFDQIVPTSDKSKDPSIEERVAKGQKLSPVAGILPESITLPFPLLANVNISAEGIKSGGNVYKGVTAKITKSGSDIFFAAKFLDIPGKTNADLNGSLKFATSSKSGEKGVTYADPALLFTINGSSEQLPTLLRTFSPDQDGNAALEVYKTASFDVNGSVAGDKIAFSNSTLKLDQSAFALAGSYKAHGQGGRPDIVLDLTTDTVDIDHIQGRLSGQNKQAVQSQPAAAPDLKKALEPVRDFSLPVNLTFDVSAQKARFNNQDINGIRIKGRAAGSALSLDVASVQDYMGAAASVKGAVADLKNLSGIDVSLYGKTDNLKSLMTSFKMDTSKLPESISGAQANVTAKGAADSLGFNADITALNGQLRASGTMTGLLDTPSFNDLSIGAKHPNLVKAIQIMNPSFSGGAGLEKPFDFQAKAIKKGNGYDLSGMKASLGATTINGDLSIDNSGAKPSIKGNLQAGDIPLDSLLGAKTGGASGGASGGGAGFANSSGGKWSKTPLETGWMQSMNMDLALSAKSITYGGWNFAAPSTRITLKDGTLNVDGLKAGLFGGNASLNARVVDPADAKQPLSLSVQTKMDNVNLEPLVTALSGTRRLKASGDVSLDMDVQASGLSSHALVSSLQGKSTLNGKDVVMKGFDLAQIGLAFVDSGKPLDRLGGIVGGATNSGETRFDTIKGVYDISQGIATITSMEMDGAAAKIVSKGNVNLPQWYIDTIHTMTFKQAKDAGSFDVAIKGSLDSPANTFGKGLFNDVLTRRLQSKAVEKLPDVLGKDLTGKLQGLGILPPTKQPAPVPSAAPVDSAPPVADPNAQSAPVLNPLPQADPAGAAPSPAAPAPQSQNSKKALEEEAGKAINGVLKGLLQ